MYTILISDVGSTDFLTTKDCKGISVLVSRMGEFQTDIASLHSEAARICLPS